MIMRFNATDGTKHLEIMRHLLDNFLKLQTLYKGGVIFLLFFITPCLVGVFINIIENGSRML